MCLIVRVACGASPGSEKDKTNTQTAGPANHVDLSKLSLPPPLEVNEEELRALTDKLVKVGSGGVPKLLQKLSGDLSSADGLQLLASMRALSLLDAKDTVPVIIQVMKSSPILELNEEGWKTLGKLAGPSSLPELLFILESPRDMPYRKLVVQVAAMNALSEIAQKDRGPDVFVGECENRRAKASVIAKLRMIEVLQKLDTSLSRNMLFAMLGDPDRDVKRCALVAINRADEPQMVSQLHVFLGNTEVQLKKEAILALGRCKAIAAVPALIGMLDSTDGGVRTNVVWALRNITGRAFSSTANAKLWLESESAEGERRFAVLSELLKNGQPRMAPLFVEELSKLSLLREKEVAALRTYLSHTDFRVRAAVCDALGQTPPSLKTCALLIGKLNDPSDVVGASAWRSLKQMTGQKLPNSHTEWSQWFQKRG